MGLSDRRPTTSMPGATMSEDLAWRLLYNALPPAEASVSIAIEGAAACASRASRTRIDCYLVRNL